MTGHVVGGGKKKKQVNLGTIAGVEDLSLLKERYEAIWDVGSR